jgi:hypothetical protein
MTSTAFKNDFLNGKLRYVSLFAGQRCVETLRLFLFVIILIFYSGTLDLLTLSMGLQPPAALNTGNPLTLFWSLRGLMSLHCTCRDWGTEMVRRCCTA